MLTRGDTREDTPKARLAAPRPTLGPRVLDRRTALGHHGSVPRLRRTHATILARGLILLTTLQAGCGSASAPPTAPGTPAPTPTPPPSDPVVVTAGDIACGPTTRPSTITCRQFDTSEIVVAINPSTVLIPGDVQYEEARYEDFLAFYDVTWGRFKPITRPVPGNHEYQTFADAGGYFDYFNGKGVANGPAGARGQGWYSFNVGSWHIVGLNSNCDKVGGCGAASPQGRWLRDDLRANTSRCTLAFWHFPRFSSGRNGSHEAMQTFWQLFYEGGGDVVLNGDDHMYERFAPQDALGRVDPAHGVREFVVGTGGRNLYQFRPPLPTSEARIADAFGVLKLKLRPDSYDWDFVPITADGPTDSGSDICR
jgi:acid phosphatase type 7